MRTSKKHCQTTRHCRESCWRVSKPTCGSDGNIYSNACRMKSKNCGKHVFEVPMAYCLSQERNRVGSSNACPVNCDKEKDRLTCSSDGNVYRSECEMKMLNCGWATLLLIIFSYNIGKKRRCFSNIINGQRETILIYEERVRKMFVRSTLLSLCFHFTVHYTIVDNFDLLLIIIINIS